LENSKDKLNRFRDEAGMFCKRWSAIVKKGDPYYNPQLTLRKNDFSLRMLPYEKIGEPYSIDELVDL
jgi:hypothetical protein